MLASNQGALGDEKKRKEKKRKTYFFATRAIMSKICQKLILPLMNIYSQGLICEKMGANHFDPNEHTLYPQVGGMNLLLL